MTEVENLLPELLSEVIGVALRDFKVVRASPDYEIDMSVWHTPDDSDNEKCVVCFAGAVIAQTLGVPSTKNYSPFDEPFNKNQFRGKISGHDRDRLHALDLIREGSIFFALHEVNRGFFTEGEALEADIGALKASWGSKGIKCYEDDPEGFIEHLEQIKAVLEKHGE